MMSEKEKIINEKVDGKKKQKQGKQDYNGEDDLIDCDICKKGVNGSECVQCDQCSGWYHVNCTMVKRIFKDLCEVEKNPNLIFGGALYFFCPPCEKAFKSNKDTKHVSNSKFEKELNVVVADRRLNEDEMTHPSLPTTTEVANRQLNEVERTHSSLPTSIASTSAENAANIAGSHVSAANVAGPNVPETKGAGPHVSAVNKRNIQSTQSQFICSFYKKGRCRHSISGKKIYNGSQCKYLHPRNVKDFANLVQIGITDVMEVHVNYFTQSYASIPWNMENVH